MVRINKCCALLFVLLMLELDCFGFVDKYGLFVLGVGFYDIVFLTKIVVVVLSIIWNSKIFRSKKISLNILPVGAVILSITSSIGANLVSGQPLVFGLGAQREWLSSILLYYPIRIWLEKGKLNYKKIVSTLYAVCVVYLTICIFQYILIDHVKFLAVAASDERYGDVRLVFNPIIPIIASAFCLDQILSCDHGARKQKEVCIWIIIGTIVLITLVTKGRMRTFSFITGMAICALMRRGPIDKKIYSIIIIGVGCCFLLSSPMGQDVLDLIFGSGTGLSADTLSIREAEKTYYLSKIFGSFSSFILGCGYPNSSWSAAVELSTPTVGNWTYYTTDIGVVGDFYYYGIIGIMWFLAVYSFLFIKGQRIYKRTSNTAFIQIVIVDIIGAITLVPLLFSSTLIIPLIFSLVEIMYTNTYYNYSCNSGLGGKGKREGTYSKPTLE